MQTIQPQDLSWIGYRFLDPMSRTFYHEECYYKAIPEFAVPCVQQLMSQGIFDDLLNRQLLPPMTIERNFSVPGFPLIFKQNTDAFSVPVEYRNSLMLRDAGLHYLALNLVLLSHNLATIDAHPANIVFQDNCCPKWCDIGSFISIDIDQNAGLQEFVRHFVYPLLLRTTSPELADISRHLAKTGCSHGAAQALLRSTVALSGSREELLNKFQLLLSGLEFTWGDTLWSEYHNALYSADDPYFDCSNEPIGGDRLSLIKQFVMRSGAKRILDIGANAGFFSIMAAGTGAQVLAVEPDETAAARCYENFRSQKGIRAEICMATADFKPRVQADLVLALAVTHHMYFTHCYGIDLIARVLARATSNTLIVEFMPNGLGGTKPNPDPLPCDYNLEGFVKALGRYFKRIETFDPERDIESSHRILIHATDRNWESAADSIPPEACEWGS